MMKRDSWTMRLSSGLLASLLIFGSPLSLAQEMRREKGNSKVPKSSAKMMAGVQKVVHLLDRMTFGPRPGEIDRVMKMGWEKFLDEQLYPDRIADQIVEAKLKNIESIHLNNSDLAKYYPRPQIIREILKARGLDLPPAGGTVQQNQGTDLKSPEGQKANPADDIKKRREYARVLAEMGYKPPQSAVQELQQAKILRATYSERQLQEVMTDFWFNHFNVYIQKGADRILTTSYERDVIRPRVFGKFEDLLKATAESPAMLFYLDNFLSAAPEGAERAGKAPDVFREMRRRDRGFRKLNDMRSGGGLVRPPRTPSDRRLDPRNLDPRGIDPSMRDNPPQAQPNNQSKIKRPRRGLNENYAREIMELHTLGVDGGYTQKDVQEVARCFTGWTLRNPRGGAEFLFNPAMHDDGEKIVLGKKISRGGGIKDGYTVIHLLATHPSTAKFVSTKLARKFVADNPPQSLVDRMAQTFQKTEGDIRQVLLAMFKSPEFWAESNYRAKIKTPFEMTISAVRAIGAETDGNPQFHRWVSLMGEGLYMAQPPTGYNDRAEYWVNTGGLLERMNYALALGSNRIPGTYVNLNSLAPDLNSSEPSQVIDRYFKLLLHGDVSPQTRATIDKSLSELQMAKAEPKVDVAKVVGLILGSPEFQRQ